ncbi:hypothetical protein MTO96_052274 [Rhipicephalus appendiculatus]
MDVNIKALNILMLAGISIAWSPIAQPAGTTGPSQAVSAVTGNTFLSQAGNGRSSSFPQQILQLPVNRPVPPQRGGERPSSYQQQGIQGQVTPGMMPLPVQQQGIHNPPTPSLHQPPGAPGSSFPSQSNTGGAPPFLQQVPHTQQLPASGPMTPQQNGGNAVLQSAATNPMADNPRNDAIIWATAMDLQFNSAKFSSATWCN